MPVVLKSQKTNTQNYGKITNAVMFGVDALFCCILERVQFEVWIFFLWGQQF